MKNRWKRLIAKCLVLSMVLGLLPNTGLNVKAAGNAPLTQIKKEDVIKKGVPVINLQMEDESKYDALKTVKDKQYISEFELYDVDGNKMQIEPKVYPLTAKGRGNSSWTMSTGKKPYNLKFEKKINLLGMGESKSWCLIANWVDTSYMRNYMAYNLACEMGMGTPDCKNVALCINGKFEGIYLLTEKVGLNEFRTEFPEDETGEDLNDDGTVTEIIVESDSRAVENNEPGRFKTDGDVWFVPKDPDPEDLAPTELPEIEKEVNAMEAAILSGDNYKDYIDVDSWVDTYIINELAKNPDFGFGNQPCYSSSYLYFREGGKVYAGPVWDFDIGYGRNDYSKNSDEGYRETADAKKYLTANTKYYKELIEKTDFMEYVIRRWKQLRADGTFEKWLGDIYTAGHNGVAGLVQQDLAAWGGTDVRVAGTFDVGRKAYDFEQECTYIKNFLNNRIAWLDTQWNKEKLDLAYSDGKWTRDGVREIVWDGGYGFIEDEKENEIELGSPQGEIPGVPVTEMTLTLDKTGIPNPVSAMWYSATDVGAGVGPEGSKPQITINTSGTYVGFITSSWWVQNNQSYTMGNNNDRVYIVTVGTDGSVTVNDGTIYLDGASPCKIENIVKDKHCGAIEGTANNYTLKYQADGKGNYQIPGTGVAVPMKLEVVEGGNQELTVTTRAEGSRYPEVLDSFESTYIKVTDGMPESWTNSNDEVIKFDEATRKVAALKAGTATITAKAGTQEVSLTFTVKEKQATELSKINVPTTGLYGLEVKRDPAPIKGTWATVAANQMSHFIYKINFTEKQFENMESIYLANGSKEQILSGEGDCYVFVNNKPWVKADSEGTISNIDGEYKFTTNFKDKEADLSQANAGLKELMQSGENIIDIYMISATDAYIDYPYFFGERKILDEVTPPEPDVEVSNVTLDKSELNLIEGETEQLIATIAPDNATDKKLTWTSSNETIAAVDSNGKITAIAQGTATITVTAASGVFTTATVIVSKKPVVEVQSVTLDKTEASLIEGKTVQLQATIIPSNATNQELTWKTSDKKVATVDATGKVTAIAPGTAIITVTSVNKKSATATITVTKKPDIGNGATMELSFASREAFESSETPETVVEKGIALLDEENGGLKQYETNETENELARMANQILYKEKALKANENSKKKGNANAEYNSNKNGNNGKNHKDDSASDKVEILPNNEGVLLWSGESMAFAAKDYDATQQILYVDAPNTTGAELTFVTPGSEPQKLEINDGEVILPEVQKREDGYAYYLIANTGSQSITLKNIWADKELEWEVSYGTLPVMYEMNAVAFEKDVLEITHAELEVNTIEVFEPVNFTVKTTKNSSVNDLIVIDRFYENGLYGQLTKEENILKNEIIWAGQIRPDNLTSTAFTFAATDKEGNVSVNPVKLTIKVTR